MPKANAQFLSREERVVHRRSAHGTRDALLAAAATAIAASGWSAVTTRRVAALADVSPALVHYHFGSMEELRRQAVLAAMAEETQGPMEALLADIPLDDAIAACVAAVARIDPGSDRFALLYEAMLAAARDDEMRSVLGRAYDDFRSALADRVRAAGGAEPEAAAVVVAAALDGVLLHRLVRPDLDLEGLTTTLVAALQTAPGTAARAASRGGPADSTGTALDQTGRG
jgi:AcrR family transcriptional regulator